MWLIAAALVLFVVPLAAFAADDSRNLHDYEAQARALYKNEPDYEKRWPVEFHVRIVEGLLADVKAALSKLGTPFHDESILKEDPLLLKGLRRSSVKVTSPNNPGDEEVTVGLDLFTDPIEVVWGQPGSQQLLPADIRRSVWTLEGPQNLDSVSVRTLWEKYLAGFQYLERFTIKVKTGNVPSEGMFTSTAALEFAGRAVGGGWRRDYGKADLTFTKTASGWRISRFALLGLTSEERSQRMFEDVTSSWLSALPAQTLNRLRVVSESDRFYGLWQHNESSVAAIQPSGLKWFPDSHAKVAVVDLDGDTWDDLFVWDIFGPSTFLHNMQGRGFEDATDRFGLNVRDASSVVFADLNNDGVMDVVVGRWAAPSEILLGFRTGPNADDLAFLPANVNLKGILPSRVSAVTAADINKDGFLDLYFATSDMFYQSDMIAFDLTLLSRDALVDRLGPRNVLLVSLGNADFSDLTQHFGLELNRSTLAASFADFNSDGYPDLALANDFGPTTLYYNEKGDFFRDVSSGNGADKIFFGMGLSWGDYDNDGDLDLYVTAMQSTAGQRITSDDKNFSSRLGGEAREDRVLGARGNILLRNNAEAGFLDASSESPLSVLRNANWAYGAQFVDLDNDSWLDVFSPNGHITLPRDARSNTLVRDY